MTILGAVCLKTMGCSGEYIFGRGINVFSVYFLYIFDIFVLQSWSLWWAAAVARRVIRGFGWLAAL